MDSLSGSDLVKYIQKENPGVSIEDVLEKTRIVTLQRILVKIQKIEYETPMDLLEDLCDFQLTLEDSRTVMEWYGGDAKLLSESRSFNTIYKFMSNKTSSCCHWFRG
jgi:hypothetical protein